nr:MAG TPA: structural protein [Caudoviricetes sp.]
MAKYFLGSVGSAEAFRMVNGQPKMAFVAKTLTDSSISVTITKDELRGGTGAPVVTNFFHDPAVAITLTDILFKEGYVEAQLGTNFTASAEAYQSETIKATEAGKLVLSKTPVDLGVLKCSDGGTIIAWYSEEGKDDYKAVIISAVDAGTKTLSDSGIENGKTYCVRYLASDNNALEAIVKSDMIPHELALIITVPIFAGDACAASKGSKAGTLTFEVPRFQLDGGQEFTFNMSSNATMNLNGTAMVMTEGCDVNSGKLFRMIEVIEGRVVEDIMIDEATAKVGAPKEDVVVYALYSDKKIAVVNNPELSGAAIGDDGILQAGKLTAAALGKTTSYTIE